MNHCICKVCTYWIHFAGCSSTIIILLQYYTRSEIHYSQTTLCAFRSCSIEAILVYLLSIFVFCIACLGIRSIFFDFSISFIGLWSFDFLVFYTWCSTYVGYSKTQEKRYAWWKAGQFCSSSCICHKFIFTKMKN